MSKIIEIVISDDQEDEITRATLRFMRDDLVKTYDARREDRGIAMYSLDKEKDLRKLERLLKAFDRVIDYCSPPSEKT